MITCQNTQLQLYIKKPNEPKVNEKEIQLSNKDQSNKKVYEEVKLWLNVINLITQNTELT